MKAFPIRNSNGHYSRTIDAIRNNKPAFIEELKAKGFKMKGNESVEKIYKLLFE
jgi:hypothetical protein